MASPSTFGYSHYYTLVEINKEQYIEKLYSFSLDELFTHMEDRHFICIFNQEAKSYFNYRYSKDITPEIFYEYIFAKPISFIEDVLVFLKQPWAFHSILDNYYCPAYQEIQIKLEKILQFHKLNDSLASGQSKNIGGKL